MNSDILLSIIIFSLFCLYGLSNIYIIIVLRKNVNSTMNFTNFLSTYGGNIKNYKKMNDLFLKTIKQNKSNYLLNKIISIIHLYTPLLIPIVLVSVAIWTEWNNY